VTRPAIAFDVYGTLGDVARMMGPLGDGADLTDLASRWRRHQLEITWLLTIMDRYEDFEVVTAQALDVALADSGLQLAEADREALLRNVELLEVFPDAVPALNHLRDAGFPLAVISNGSPRMLESMLGHAGIHERFAAVVSVAEIGAYKPAPAVYHHAARRLGRAIGDVWLVSGNPFDAAGAKVAGMKVAKVERGPSFQYPFAAAPDLTVTSLEELPAALGAALAGRGR